jgi:hypothetical protein
MLTHEEALVHARQHLYSQRPPVEWVWVLRPGQRVTDGWFFYYGLEPVRFIRTSAFAQFGGAPGFLVGDDGSVRTVGWQELSRLLPPEPKREVVLPDIVSVSRLAELANLNIYTVALMIRELRAGDETSKDIAFEGAAKVLSCCGVIAKKAA